MKKIYSPFQAGIYSALLLISLLFISCSKDFWKSYDDRILGQWHITGVNRVGLGGNTDQLPFRSGTFVFYENGTLTYTVNGQGFSGSWDIEKRYDQDNEMRRVLKITAVNFSSQQILSQFYDDMIFTGTDHFKAYSQSGFHQFVTHFRR